MGVNGIEGNCVHILTAKYDIMLCILPFVLVCKGSMIVQISEIFQTMNYFCISQNYFASSTPAPIISSPISPQSSVCQPPALPPPPPPALPPPFFPAHIAST